MNFVYSAMDARGRSVREEIEAATAAEAQRALTDRGLFILSLDQAPEAGRSRGRARRPGAKRSFWSAGSREASVAGFARMMSMMLEAGAPVVTAIEAALKQIRSSQWRAVLTSVRDDVAGGASLAQAVARHPAHFTPMACCIIAAGETTATLTEAFRRLTAMLEARTRSRANVIGALIYPAMLMLLSLGVLITLSVFVLPKFAALFASLNAKLPTLTLALLGVASSFQYWIAPVGGGLAAGLTAIVIWARSASGRRTIGETVVRLPVLGRIVASFELTRILRIWSTMLKSRVPMLDAIQELNGISSNPVFVRLLRQIEEAVTQGRLATAVLAASPLMPPTIAAALCTGEESGRLAESMEFVAGWMEEQNQHTIATLARMLEPLILVILGVVVGAVCIALFLPLFDIATAT